MCVCVGVLNDRKSVEIILLSMRKNREISMAC